jgi:hypothetical protein
MDRAGYLHGDEEECIQDFGVETGRKDTTKKT